MSTTLRSPRIENYLQTKLRDQEETIRTLTRCPKASMFASPRPASPANRPRSPGLISKRIGASSQVTTNFLRDASVSRASSPSSPGSSPKRSTPASSPKLLPKRAVIGTPACNPRCSGATTPVLNASLRGISVPAWRATANRSSTPVLSPKWRGAKKEFPPPSRHGVPKDANILDDIELTVGRGSKEALKIPVMSSEKPEHYYIGERELLMTISAGLPKAPSNVDRPQASAMYLESTKQNQFFAAESPRAFTRYTSMLRANETFQAGVCEEKKAEDSKHPPGIHPSAYESCLSQRLQMLRDLQHEFNEELLCTPRHRIEERFRGSLCEGKQAEVEKVHDPALLVPRLRSTSPGVKRKRNSSESKRSQTFMSMSTASYETEWDSLSSFTTDSSASDVHDSKSAFETRRSLPELRQQLQHGRLQYVRETMEAMVAEMKVRGLDVSETPQDKVDLSSLEKMTMGSVEAQRIFEESICSEKKHEDEEHRPGIHPLASCLSPRAALLRDSSHELNRELRCISRNRLEERFWGSLCDDKRVADKQLRRSRSCSPGTAQRRVTRNRHASSSPTLRTLYRKPSGLRSSPVQTQRHWESTLCKDKKLEDTRHDPGIHPLVFESLTPERQWLRDNNHELNPELRCSARVMLDDHFKATLCDVKKSEDVSFDHGGCQEPFSQTKTNCDDSPPFCQLIQPGHTLQRIDSGCELSSVSASESQKVLEESLCDSKKEEDERHPPGIHPLAYESSLTKRLLFLREMQNLLDPNLACTPHRRIEERFHGSMREERRNEHETQLNEPLPLTHMPGFRNRWTLKMKR